MCEQYSKEDLMRECKASFSHGLSKLNRTSVEGDLKRCVHMKQCDHGKHASMGYMQLWHLHPYACI